MPNFISDRRLYLNQDRTKVVEEGDESAAFLLVGEGGMVSEEDADKYNLRLREHKPPSALQLEQDALLAAEARGATDEARVRRQNIANLAEEESKAKSAASSKMRGAPPENKASTTTSPAVKD